MPLTIGQFNDGYLPVTDGVVTVARNYTYWLNQKYAKCMLFAPTKTDQSFHEAFDVVGYRKCSKSASSLSLCMTNPCTRPAS